MRTLSFQLTLAPPATKTETMPLVALNPLFWTAHEHLGHMNISGTQPHNLLNLNLLHYILQLDSNTLTPTFRTRNPWGQAP